MWTDTHTYKCIFVCVHTCIPFCLFVCLVTPDVRPYSLCQISFLAESSLFASLESVAQIQHRDSDELHSDKTWQRHFTNDYNHPTAATSSYKNSEEERMHCEERWWVKDYISRLCRESWVLCVKTCVLTDAKWHRRDDHSKACCLCLVVHEPCIFRWAGRPKQEKEAFARMLEWESLFHLSW